MENLQGSFGQLADGVFPTFLPAGLGHPMIASADIGQVAASLLVEGPPASSPRVVELGGAPISPTEVAATLSDVLGRPVRVAEGPVTAMAGALAGYGIPADIAGLYQEMTEGLISGHVAFEGGHRRASGSTSLATFLRGVLSR